jgi:hypothetical protein
MVRDHPVAVLYLVGKRCWVWSRFRQGFWLARRRCRTDVPSWMSVAGPREPARLTGDEGHQGRGTSSGRME